MTCDVADDDWMPFEELRQLAVRMAKSFALLLVLLRDLNDDRFYLVGD